MYPESHSWQSKSVKLRHVADVGSFSQVAPLSLITYPSLQYPQTVADE